MSHEPECLEVGIELDPAEFCPACITARAAYQRGREDAANAVGLLGSWLDKTVDFGDAIAAARGEGDCQHDWQHLKGEKCPTCRRCGAARGDGERA